MFLKKINILSRKLSFRLTFAFLIFYLPIYLVIFGAFDFLGSKYLVKRDQDHIENQLHVYQDLYEKEGIAGLKNIISNPKLHRQSIRFFISISGPDKKSMFLHLPEDDQYFNITKIEKQISSFGKIHETQWNYISSEEGDEDALEVLSTILDSGIRLHVGASTEERDILLKKFRDIFIVILIPLIIISVFGSILIAYKILRPLENLTVSIKKIREGRLSIRAPIPIVKDELYDLTIIFNEMINQVDNLVKAMKETLDNIAHDLKTPLTRSRIISELALQKDTHQELKSAVEENIENADSMLQIVNTIMEVSRLDSHTLILNKEKFSTKKLIDEIVDLYYFVAEESKIQFELHCQDFIINADRVFMKRALANLIDNAIKYSNSHTCIVFSCIETVDEFIFSVKDQGIGISKEDIPRIWERLYRADRSRHMSGLGLGLSMVKVFVDSHNGYVSLTSELGLGSEFKLTISKK